MVIVVIQKVLLWSAYFFAPLFSFFCELDKISQSILIAPLVWRCYGSQQIRTSMNCRKLMSSAEGEILNWCIVPYFLLYCSLVIPGIQLLVHFSTCGLSSANIVYLSHMMMSYSITYSTLVIKLHNQSEILSRLLSPHTFWRTVTSTIKHCKNYISVNVLLLYLSNLWLDVCGNYLEFNTRLGFVLIIVTCNYLPLWTSTFCPVLLVSILDCTFTHLWMLSMYSGLIYCRVMKVLKLLACKYGEELYHIYTTHKYVSNY